MILEVTDIVGDLENLDIDKLVQISDKLWEFGNLEEIKAKVNPKLFNLHIGINIVGIWKGEGWSTILGEQADLVPYIPEVLTKLNLSDIREAFEKVIELYPEGTVFKSDCEEYYDIANFLQTFSHKPQNERLRTIEPEKRREMVKQMRQRVNDLDEITAQYWLDDVENEGWKQVLNYLQQIM